MRFSPLRLFASSVLALSGLAVAGCGGGGGVAPPSAPGEALGTTTSFDLPGNDGVLVSIPQPSAVVTVVASFTPTCESCADRVPALVDQNGAIDDVGGRLVLVAVLAEAESDQDAAAALAGWGLPGEAHLIDRADAVRRSLGIDKAPGAAVVDGAGKVVWIAPPNASAADIAAAAVAAAQKP